MPIKPAQAPIYRAIERLLQWAIPTTERLPKSLPYQTLGGKMIKDIMLCLEVTIMAVNTPDPATRLQCIDIIISRMTMVKTTMRQFAQARIKGAPVVSYKQEAAFLDLINPVATQAGAWRIKTGQQVSNHV